MKNYVVIIFLLIIICNFSVYFHQTYGQVKFGERVINKGAINPVVLDSLLKVEVVVEASSDIRKKTQELLKKLNDQIKELDL